MTDVEVFFEDLFTFKYILFFERKGSLASLHFNSYHIQNEIYRIHFLDHFNKLPTGKQLEIFLEKKYRDQFDKIKYEPSVELKKALRVCEL